MTTQAPDPGADDKRGQPGEELNPEDPGQARERAMRGRLHQNLRGLGFRRGDGDKLAADNPAQKRLPFEEAGMRLVALGHVRFLDQVARLGHHVADCGHCRARRLHAGWPVGCHGLNADNRGPVFGGEGHTEPSWVNRKRDTLARPYAESMARSSPWEASMARNPLCRRPLAFRVMGLSRSDALLLQQRFPLDGRRRHADRRRLTHGKRRRYAPECDHRDSRRNQ